ncbi:MAG: 4Fe-4S binding protein [Deltaproteobacteria bacterium]|nr:4Fe-4S binding protein [Deltaproteobacteria bacterium]MBW2180775.1 4Fe-4S binding protein [Deltaproteobacteria bacterium]MBW2363783.1 4Fe-4S binding protein [Deltaproteobacteria bacterium]
MSSAAYKYLLEVMIKRRGPYAGADIPEFYELVETLFTPEEAEVNNAMPRGPVTAADMAKEMGKNKEDLKQILEAMANKGLCSAVKREDVQYYMAAPFMPGIFEYQFMPGKTTDRDKKIAGLIYAYKTAYESSAGPRKMTFPTTRVITVDKKIEAGNKIHTYDQMKTYIDKNEYISAATCFCRHEAKLRGEDIHDMPMDVCMSFGNMAEYVVERLGGKRLSREEAMKVLDLSEEAGLIHMSRNTADNIDFVCNCDRWHCEVVTAMLKQPKPALFFNSGFHPVFDPDLCTACEECIDRCPPEAILMGDNDIPEVDLDRCFGCAVCATGCPSEAIKMEAKPGFPAPPKDIKEFAAAIKASFSNG